MRNIRLKILLLRLEIREYFASYTSFRVDRKGILVQRQCTNGGYGFMFKWTEIPFRIESIVRVLKQKAPAMHFSGLLNALAQIQIQTGLKERIGNFIISK
jgi:hypothetical protein